MKRKFVKKIDMNVFLPMYNVHHIAQIRMNHKITFAFNFTQCSYWKYFYLNSIINV